MPTSLRALLEPSPSIVWRELGGLGGYEGTVGSDQ